MVESCIYSSTLKFGDNLETCYLWFWFTIYCCIYFQKENLTWKRQMTMAMGVVQPD